MWAQQFKTYISSGAQLKTKPKQNKKSALDLVSLLTTANARPSLACLSVKNIFLDFTGILMQMQYAFCKFMQCFTWEFHVVLHVRWWAHCEAGAMGNELWPHLSVSLLLICLDLGWLQVDLAACPCTKLQYVIDVSRVSGSSQPAFASLLTLKVGQMQFAVLGNAWATLHLNWFEVSAPLMF